MNLRDLLPRTAEEWMLFAVFGVIGLYAGHAYGQWLWGQIL